MKSRWIMRLIGVAGLLALILALVASGPARAVEFTNEGVVAAEQVVDDDLFINADQVIIDGTINGDLFINSETAQINGTVNGNVMVYSAALIMNGKVDGSLVFTGQGAQIAGEVTGTVYAAGNILRFTPQARVGRNVFYAGFALEAQPGSEITRDIYITGYQAAINSQAVRDVDVSAHAVSIGGQVERDVNLVVDAPGNVNELMASFNEALPALSGIEIIPIMSSGLSIDPEARIGGRLAYASPVDQSAAIQAQPGSGVIFTQTVDAEAVKQTPKELAAVWLTARFQELATLLILGGLAAALLPVLLRHFATQARQRPHVNAWKGLLVLGAGIALFILAFLTIIIISLLSSIVSLSGLSMAILGIGLSGLATAFNVFLLLVNYGSKLVLAQWAGEAVLQRFSPALVEHRYWPIILGILLYILLRLIPFVSALVGIVVTLIGLGAMWLTFRRHRTRLCAVAQPVETAA